MSYQYGGDVKNEPTIIHKNSSQRNAANGSLIAHCGTLSGYRRHIRNREATCQPCKDAYAADRRRLRGNPPTTRVKVAECGTESGYNRHLRQRTVPCDACLTATREAGRARYGYKPAAIVVCGTASGYARHTRQKTRHCQPCRDAWRTYQRERRAFRSTPASGIRAA